MKLDRNINGTGRGKYGLIKNRRVEEIRDAAKAGDTSAVQEHGKVVLALGVLAEAGIIEWGEPGTESEFFVIKLRDKYANPALVGYANRVLDDGDDPEYAFEIAKLAHRCGTHSPFCKKPD